MAFSSCFCHSQFSPKTDHTRQAIKPRCSYGKDQIFSFSLKRMSTKLFGQRVAGLGTDLNIGWSFVGGSRVIMTPKFALLVRYRRGCGVYATWLASSQIASSAFTLGTVAVLPFYTLMVLAPKAELTKKSIKSTIPYVVLGLLYAYLLFRSWTPNTIQLMFASKYWLPELPGIAKMFSSEMTLASAWIHLLAVDLFAARQIFHDGLENLIETRHSVSLCLLFCPIGIMIHFITKMLTKSDNSTSQRAGSDLCV